MSILELAERVIARVNPEAKVEFTSYAEAYDESFEDIRQTCPGLWTKFAMPLAMRPRKDLDAIIDSVAEYQRAAASN